MSGNVLGHVFQSFSALPVLSDSFPLASRREKSETRVKELCGKNRITEKENKAGK